MRRRHGVLPQASWRASEAYADGEQRRPLQAVGGSGKLPSLDCGDCGVPQDPAWRDLRFDHPATFSNRRLHPH